MTFFGRERTADSAPCGGQAAERDRDPGRHVDEIERYAITKTLESTGGSEILNISVRKIQYKLHGTRARRSRPAPRSRIRTSSSRQRHGEAGAAGTRFDADRPSVIGDDPVDQRQTQSGSLVLGREERVENR